jgi:hypothetical protein
MTGKGQPNPKDGRNVFQEGVPGKLQEEDFHKTITVNASAHEAFKSINSISHWWTEDLEGKSQKLNDEFTVHFGDVHVSKQKVVEVIPDKKVVWLVTDSNLNFVKDRQEWTGTKISFEIYEKDNKTEISFTHQGLVPRDECFDACSEAWTDYLENSLMNLISTGKGQPTQKGAN